ncbi:uncharacterized protein LOC132613647 [Lycium barbarum]|uniref:uncharacterized protein LOC132613647 n=1 Tax=Lycium barbarum TaxID=112863 RepID=UPI00293EE835|nr:uncharacterized protein LOC132613647 [Lycium barbarum]
MWRIWKLRLPLDDILKRIKIAIVSRCYCCDNPQHEETVQHLFLIGNLATSVRLYYTSVVGGIGPMVKLHQTVWKWWDFNCSPKLKPNKQVASAFICWQLWKRRNARAHGETMSKNKVIYYINQNLYHLVVTRYLWLKNIPQDWPQLVQFLEGYKPIMKIRRVQWRYPIVRWYKCNTDSALRGNPGACSATFYMRNNEGDVVFSSARRLADTTNICAEAAAI